MVANGVVLLVLTIWVLRPSASGNQDPDVMTSASTSAPGALPIPTKEQLMAQAGVRFGISAPQVPYSTGEVSRISTAAGVRPTMLQYFIKWTEDYRPDAVAASYEQGALPVISWEPWAGSKSGEDQPDFALARIINGSFDAYINRFAMAIHAQQWPVAIRFAHEMNGKWYPWAETKSGNSPGQYVQAWRHIHDIFTKAGATNVIWIWSPNILRPVPNVSLANLYPGEQYVDWVGMVGYAVAEKTASAVYEPTITALRKFTQKPIVITETGAQPGANKVAWIKDFFKWLPRHPEIIGFTWFEYSEAEGGSSDWRFTSVAECATAFREGIKGVMLTAPPTSVLASTSPTTSSPSAAPTTTPSSRAATSSSKTPSRSPSRR